MSAPAIAAALHLCANTVRKWIGRYAGKPATPVGENPDPQTATPAPQPPPQRWLADAPRSGRPDTFTAKQVCDIVALACEKPQDHNRSITHWTAGELSDQAVKEKIVASISARHVSRLLAAIDLQPHRSRYWLNAKADPQKDDKIRAICKVYGQAQDAAARQEFTFSVDEKTGIQALERIAGDQPMQPGQPQRREFEYTRHGTLSLLAGMDVASGTIKAVCSPTRNEADFLGLVDSLVKSQPQARKVTFVLDNLNTHKSESLVRYVAEYIVA